MKSRSALDQFESAIHVVSKLDTKTRKELKSPPKYKYKSDEDKRNPNDNGGRIYLNFYEYFGEKHELESNSELRISQLLIVQNPKYFSPREVAEAQDYLYKFK